MAKDKELSQQDLAKEKLIKDGITDPAILEILTDEYAGQGGNYTFDPVTNKRTKTD